MSDNNSIIMDPRKQLQHKIVHLDLKGMPMLAKSYQQVFPFLSSLGVTGVLMEYEDMFPYHGRLGNISHRHSYSREEVLGIQETAKASHLELIPLIQTFGHMEFVLKLEDFAPLREVPKYMQVKCPSQPGSVALVKEMIDQVMTIHPGLTYFHMGADEVYHIGQCPLCQDRMVKEQLTEGDLFLAHVKLVAGYVKEKHNVQPLMWDDEFRKLDQAIIRSSGIADLVEIVVWNYHGDVENRLPSQMWDNYAALFKNKVWIGTAFKGADKPNSVLVNATHYLNNHYSWLRVMSERAEAVGLKGVVFTGWQRYDHFSVLCEILPSAIPCLTACLKLLSGEGEVRPIAEFMANVAMFHDDYLNYASFPGSDIHQQILLLEHYKALFARLKDRPIFLGWATDYNLNHAFSNPSLIESMYPEVNSLKVDMEKWHPTTVTCMKTMFPAFAIHEWMETTFVPVFQELKKVHEKMGIILEKTIFPRQPIVDRENEPSTN